MKKYLLYLLGFAVLALFVLWVVWKILVGVVFPLIAFVVGGVIQVVFGVVVLLAVFWGLLKILGYLRSLGIFPKS
ncbi:hypothetical protein CMK18_15775 [Candidatus Poribacteria bacterium]|nr:hypothetical protein [Candidatus Poribacteria bacterium]